MDDYEREHLRGRGRVVYRDKVVMPRGAAAVIALVGAGFLATGIAGIVAAVPVLAIMGLSFGVPILGVVPLLGVVRLLVTERELRIQVGLGGPRVDIDQIERAIVLAPGDERARGAKEYPLKDGAHALELHLADGAVIRIVTTEARVDALAAAVEEARGSRTPASRVRVGSEPEEELSEASPTAGESRRSSSE